MPSARRGGHGGHPARGARAQDHHQRERAETADRERVLQVDQQLAIDQAPDPLREQAEREPGVAEVQGPQRGLVPDRDRPPAREAERGENAGSRGRLPRRRAHSDSRSDTITIMRLGQRRALETGLHAAAELLSPPMRSRRPPE